MTPRNSLCRRVRSSLRHVLRRIRAVRTWVAAHQAGFSVGRISMLTAGFIVLVNNQRLFSLMGDRLDVGSVRGLACFVTVYALLTAMLGTVFLVFGHGRLLKPLLMMALILSAVLGYVTQELGIIVDVTMIENAVETVLDRNKKEAAELISVQVMFYVFLLGILPSMGLVFCRVAPESLRRSLTSRLKYLGGIVAVLGILILANYRTLSYFSRANRDLRFYATPTYAADSLRKYMMSTVAGNPLPFTVIRADAVRSRNPRGRTIGIMVVGETARADHFSLNGYARTTNPLLEKRDLVNFSHARSSATSTVLSVPCMFSFLGRKAFTRKKAARQSNVLDVLSDAGVRVVWIDNNSSDKGVCERIGSINLNHDADPASPFYGRDGGYYDEVLLDLLLPHIEDTEADVLIVLHTMGSHGPAYYRRYPDAFERFVPSCKAATPQASSNEEVTNAYDNSLLYTDYVLDRIIDFLEKECPEDDAFLFYASDHGESLGEYGVYLHGLPYFIAPDAQTHVPMFAWFSDRFLSERGLDRTRLQARSSAPCSHDSISHSLLGMFDVRCAAYRSDLDLFRSD